MLVNEMFPKKYANGDDLKGTTPTMTIAKIVQEKMHPAPGQPGEVKFVIYFEKAQKGIVLSRSLFNAIATATGQVDSNNWPGQRVQLYAEMMNVAGRQLNVIRARKAPNGPSQVPAALETDDDDDTTG